MEAIFKIILPLSPKKEFTQAWMALAIQLQVNELMLGDPFLTSVFKKVGKSKLSNEELLMLLDLQLSCGEETNQELLNALKKADKMELTFAFYTRVVMLYYFRFHREKEKKSIRSLLKGMRLLHKSLELPKVA
jgi:hypothetical protein